MVTCHRHTQFALTMMGKPFLDTYDTNFWGDCRWLQAQNHRRLDDSLYTPESRWQWIAADKMPNWFRHKSRQGILCFATTAHYQKQDKESAQLSNFCVDFDAESDGDFPRIVNSVGFITEFFEKRHVPKDDLRIWFSGGRSYHLEIPYQFFGIQPMEGLNRYWKFVAETINEQMPDDGFPLDTSMYSNPRMFRMPNSFYPKYNAYKIELKLDEIHLPIKDIRDMAREPRESLTQELWEMTDAELFESYEPYVWARAWWEDEVVQTVDELEAKRQELIPVDTEALKAMINVPICIQDLRANAAERLEISGTANKAQIHDATHSLAKGIPESEAVVWIESWISDARPKYENTASVVKSIYANPSKYKFSCSLAWHLNLSCAREACELYNKHDLRKHSERVRVVADVDFIPSTETSLGIDDARKQMADHFTDLIASWWLNPTQEIIAYTLPPGGGKTVTPLKALERGIIGHTLYFAPRHAMLDERVIDFPAYHWVRARSFVDESLSPDDQLCIMPDVCDAYAQKRYNAVKSICLTKCEKCFNCYYRWQFVPHDAVLTHEYLFSPTFMEFLTTGDGGLEPPHSWVVIVDEPSISTFIDTVHITNETLTKAQNRTDSEAVQTLLDVVRTTIEAACNGGNKTVRIVGQAAFERIEATAKQVLGVDLSELVARASEALDEDKTPRIRVEFGLPVSVSQNGKSISMWFDGAEIRLPMSEIEFDEANRIVILPKWLADKHNLSGIVETSSLMSEAVDGDKPKLLLNFVDDLLRCLEADIAKFKPFNSPMVITRRFGKPTLSLNLKRSLDHVTGPVVMLDACADGELLSALTGRKVNLWSVPLKMESEEVIQITDGQYGITSLWDKSKKAPRKAAIRLMKAVNRIIEGKESNTLIVTWKALAQWLIAQQENGKFDSRVAIAWYGGIEGLNVYQHLEIAILIGTPTAPVDDIIEMGHAIWANDETPLETEIRQVWRQYAYRDGDGSGMEALVMEFADDRLNMILRNYRENEIIQAAHRIRPLLHENRTIYLLTNLPLDQLPPTKLTTIDELIGESMPEGYAEFVELVKSLLETYSGVWTKLMEVLVCDGKSSKATLVIYIYSYYNSGFAWKLPGTTMRRWLTKAASELGLHSTRVAFGKGLSIKVLHREGELDESKIRNLWSRLNREAT